MVDHRHHLPRLNQAAHRVFLRTKRPSWHCRVCILLLIWFENRMERIVGRRCQAVLLVWRNLWHDYKGISLSFAPLFGPLLEHVEIDPGLVGSKGRLIPTFLLTLHYERMVGITSTNLQFFSHMDPVCGGSTPTCTRPLTWLHLLPILPFMILEHIVVEAARQVHLFYHLLLIVYRIGCCCIHYNRKKDSYVS